MLHIHPLQNWFLLSDPAVEEALYEMTSMRLFSRLTLSTPIPEGTRIMSFRHLLEKHLFALGTLVSQFEFLTCKRQVPIVRSV